MAVLPKFDIVQAEVFLKISDDFVDSTDESVNLIKYSDSC